MASYQVTGINIGSFPLGESDKVITIFSPERGLIKAVAKGARKPGSKIAGRAEILQVNDLLISSTRSIDIITQAQTVKTFSRLRQNLELLSYGLYYAELTVHFGVGLCDEAKAYFDYLLFSLGRLNESGIEPAWLCLTFEMGLLEMLGYQPELDSCVLCRQALNDYNLAIFHEELGGIVCRSCLDNRRMKRVAQSHDEADEQFSFYGKVQVTPLVWKHLVLAGQSAFDQEPSPSVQNMLSKQSLRMSLKAARNLVQSYIEERIGKRIKALDLLNA